MSRPASTTPAPVSRPTGLDYFLILVGCSLSILLAQVSRPVPEPQPDVPGWVVESLLESPLDPRLNLADGLAGQRANLPDLPVDQLRAFPVVTLMLLLPQGVILLWPVFYTLQRLRGRPQVLSAGEWLWGFAWLGTILLTAWTLWLHWSPPDFAKDLLYSPQAVWTILVLPSMALIAAIIGLIGLIARWKQAWTHTFGLVLIIWPVFPMAGLFLWTKLPWKWVN
jgi:hypothetical protein